MFAEIVLATHLLITRPVFEEQRRRIDETEIPGPIPTEQVRREYEKNIPHYIMSWKERGFQLDESRSAAPPQYAQVDWAVMENAGLKVLLTDLAALLQGQDYSDEFIRPTQHAVATTWTLLSESSSAVSGLFPVGTVYPDGDGGLRIEWIRPKREMRLAVSAQRPGKTYIYHESGDQYDIDYKVTGNKLAFWLNWLNEGGSAI
jgi:hypothetical protein